MNSTGERNQWLMRSRTFRGTASRARAIRNELSRPACVHVRRFGRRFYTPAASLYASRVLILASSSPRRLELLRLLDVAFEVDPADVDETLRDGEDPRDAVLRLAEEKGSAVASRHPADLVLAADTVVVLDGEVMGKPGDTVEAASMLRRLSGRSHVVHTGMALIEGGGGRQSGHATTTVRFRALTDEEIEAYTQTGEPLGKAGAYAIQGLGGTLVEGLDGELSTVVGLNLTAVAGMLGRVGVPHALRP